MNMLRRSAAILALALLGLNAHARSGVPVAEFENMPAVAASGQPASPAQIKAAIQAAAQQNGWTVAAPSPNHLVASLNVRGKHTVVTDISYAPGQYSVKYKDSANMNFDPSTRVIHPFYNKWVQGLVDGIRAEVGRR